VGYLSGTDSSRTFRWPLVSATRASPTMDPIKLFAEGSRAAALSTQFGHEKHFGILSETSAHPNEVREEACYE
jgi:hypothetical protein